MVIVFKCFLYIELLDLDLSLDCAFIMFVASDFPCYNWNLGTLKRGIPQPG